MGSDADTAMLPLETRVFWILLVLAESPLHGYAILKEVRDRSATDLRLGPTTLYRTLYRLVDDGLVEPSESAVTEEDERRQYYALTRAGRRVLKAELERLEQLVRAGRAAFRATARQGSR